MKQFLMGLGAVVALSATNVRAEQLSAFDIQNAMMVMRKADAVQNAPQALNWKVGDYQKASIEMAFGKGDSLKKVTKDEPSQNAVWLNQDINLLGQKQTSEALISRADGKTLKLIVNGKEQDLSQPTKVDIIEQSETEVTVPAGKFECMYVKAKITQGSTTQELELWANPIDVNIDGSLKTVIQSQFGPVTILLTEFGPKH